MENGNRRNLYLVTLSVSLALVMMGVSSAWATLVLPKFKQKLTKVDMSLHEIPTMLALSPVGFAVGSLATGYTADKFGRRITILASALPFTIGSFLVAFTAKAWLVCVAYFLWGCGTGIVSTVVNYYLSEIADKDVRGTLSLITGFMFKFGHLLAMTAGPYLNYENLNQVMAVLPVLFFVFCWWIPETPYFCLKNGNVAGARKSLRTLRGYRDEKILEAELQTMQANVKNEMKHSSSVKELFVGKQYRKAIVIAVGLKLTQMMTGAVVLKQYLGLIVNDINLNIGVELAFVIYGVATFIVSMCSSVLVDRVNRRPLLIFSYIGTGASLAAVGLYFFLQEVIHVNPDALAIFNFVPFVGINLANVISTLGFSSLIFIIPAEIFPINVKAIAMTFLSLLGAALGTGIALGYQRVKDLGGFTAIFWIFAAFTFGGSVFSYFYVIETKGKDLRDIQAELQGDYYDPVAVDDNVGKEVTSNDETKESTEMEELNKKADIL